MGEPAGTVEPLLAATVGEIVLRRGRDVLRHARVGSVTWNGGRTSVIARVRGNSSPSYVTSVAFGRSKSGELSSVSGTCSCPVGTNCKHVAAVALHIADEVNPGDVPAPAAPSWDAALRTLLPQPRALERPDGAQRQPEAALLFDTGDGEVRIRPLLPGRNGGWVRSGISWSDNYKLRLSPVPRAQRFAAILSEIAAMRPSPAGYYTYQVPAWLSLAELGRAVWDVLSDARANGLPLLTEASRGEPGVPVVLEGEPVSLSLDLRRTGHGLDVAPIGLLGDERLMPNQLGLLGSPPHGIVLDGPGPLRLARLLRPQGVDAAIFLATPPTVVPGGEEERFLTQLLPELLRSLPVSCSDGSVELPEPAPPSLLLTLDHRAGNETGVRWNWRYGEAEEPLWDAFPGERDASFEAGLLAALHPVLAVAPWLAQPDRPDRLAPEATLRGMTTVAFLADILPGLRDREGVEVVENGSPADYHAAEDKPVIAFNSSETPERDWLDLAVSVTVDGEKVPFLDLFVALANGATHVILPSGTYFALDREQFASLAALIEESRALYDAPPNTVRLSRLNASMWEDVEAIATLNAEALSWRDKAKALLGTTGVSPTTPPGGLAATLRPYQQDGFDWLVFLHAHGLGGVLADEMGLGKTVQALALIAHVRERGLSDRPFLVVAPTSVVSNWAAECARFTAGLRVATITETRKRRGVPLSGVVADADIVITSYALFRLEHESYLEIGWEGLFLDEAQFAKNHLSKAYECARRLPVDFKLLMTGTPMENNLTELWSLLSIAAPGLFPQRTKFEEYYRAPIERGRDPERLAQLRRRARPLMLRRTKSQVLLDLPDKQEQVLEIDLENRHRKIYDTYLARERQKVLGMLGDLEKNRFRIFRSLTLLRQASLDVTLVDAAHAGVPATKLDTLMEKVEEIAGAGHRVVIFSQFTRFLTAARDRIEEAGLETCYLDGKTKARGAVVTQFKTGAAPVFLISLKAGGFGLNLTEADYCIVLDPWWNPAAEAQAVDRIHRIGQTSKVMVYRLVARDTIEEKVMALKAEKAALFTSIVDGGDFASGALTASDIRSLVS